MVKLLNMSNFTFSHNVFYAICILKSFNSHILMLSAASLNLRRSQNGVLGNGLNISAYYAVLWGFMLVCN